MQPKTLSALLLLALAALLLAAGCAPKSAEAQKEYYHWFEVNKKAGAGADALWGLSGVKVFGYYCPYNNFLGFGQSNNPLKQISASPLQYQGKGTCWVEGRDAAGVKVSVQRDVTLNLSLEPGSQQWTAQPQFSDPRPLTTWDLIREWLIAAYLGPVLIFIFLAVILNADTLLDRLTLAQWGTGILVLPWVGYISYLGFGTTLAVFLGIGAYVLIYFLLLAQLIRWITSLIG